MSGASEGCGQSSEGTGTRPRENSMSLSLAKRAAARAKSGANSSRREAVRGQRQMRWTRVSSSTPAGWASRGRPWRNSSRSHPPGRLVWAFGYPEYLAAFRRAAEALGTVAKAALVCPPVLALAIITLHTTQCSLQHWSLFELKPIN